MPAAAPVVARNLRRLILLLRVVLPLIDACLSGRSSSLASAHAHISDRGIRSVLLQAAFSDRTAVLDLAQ
jgi:hypothetical protein